MNRRVLIFFFFNFKDLTINLIHTKGANRTLMQRAAARLTKIIGMYWQNSHLYDILLSFLFGTHNKNKLKTLKGAFLKVRALISSKYYQS